MAITGKDLIDWGHEPGPWFKDAIASAKKHAQQGHNMEAVRRLVDELAPEPIETIALRTHGEKAFHVNIDGQTKDEIDNIAKVKETMTELMRTPVVEAAAVMPDACPAGPLGTIPVGGVVKSKHIHPGMHSADICCSVAITMCGKADPIKLLDAFQSIAHFGGGGRPRGKQIRPDADLLDQMDANPILGRINGFISTAIEHTGSSGDGNHFGYVGSVRSTGETALVTHHGSRKPGALLYKEGMKIAQKHCREVSPDTLKANVWIDAGSDDGHYYWQALQMIRDWTKSNHETLHDMALEAAGAKRTDRFWNEHNFLFQRGDAFYHAKGATPGWADFAHDSSGLTLVPLNMAEPILITRGLDADHGLGFLPHGAGRNYSRAEHGRRNVDRTPEQMMAEETKDIDARFWSGIPDASELPSAYKNADEFVRQIEHFGLAEIVDYVDPIGSIMAGDWMRPHRERRAQRRAEASSTPPTP